MVFAFLGPPVAFAMTILETQSCVQGNGAIAKKSTKRWDKNDWLIIAGRESCNLARFTNP